MQACKLEAFPSMSSCSKDEARHRLRSIYQHFRVLYQNSIGPYTPKIITATALETTHKNKKKNKEKGGYYKLPHAMILWLYKVYSLIIHPSIHPPIHE